MVLQSKVSLPSYCYLTMEKNQTVGKHLKIAGDGKMSTVTQGEPQSQFIWNVNVVRILFRSIKISVPCIGRKVAFNPIIFMNCTASWFLFMYYLRMFSSDVSRILFLLQWWNGMNEQEVTCREPLLHDYMDSLVRRCSQRRRGRRRSRRKRRRRRRRRKWEVSHFH